MSGIEKFLNVLGFQIEWEEPNNQADSGHATVADDKNSTTRQSRRTETKSAADQIPKTTGSAQVVLLEPDKISDAKEICNELKSGKTVVINVERLNKSDVMRLCDFISGATYALAGKMKEISENVLVIAPSNVDIKTTEIESAPSYLDDDDDEY